MPDNVALEARRAELRWRKSLERRTRVVADRRRPGSWRVVVQHATPPHPNGGRAQAWETEIVGGLSKVAAERVRDAVSEEIGGAWVSGKALGALDTEVRIIGCEQERSHAVIEAEEIVLDADDET